MTSEPGLVNIANVLTMIRILLVTGVDYVQQAMRLRRSEPAPHG